jgi:RNA polymerase sigma factor (sigma-70 family)
MRDSEIVAAIVAGQPDGLAEAYDKYAAGLFTYCRSLLREPADAADAVQDTYVIAASKLAELRDPDRLRPWLYAVARNECHRRLRAGNISSALDESAEVIDHSADVSDEAERAQLRDLVRAAITGLNPGDQEVIELSLRHELEGPDLADALGVPRNHAHALLSRARAQLEKSLGALLVARSGRQSCPALDNLLSGWDGKMTVLMRKRVSRHIERCDVCRERKRHEMRPVMLLGLAPLAMIPAGLRDRVLSLCADGTPQGVAQRAAIVNHAGAFGPHGFPVPLNPPKLAGWRPGHGHAGWRPGHGHAGWRPGHGHAAMAAGAAATAAGVAAVIAVLAITTTHHAHRPPAGAAAGPSASHLETPLPAPSSRRGFHPTANPTAAAPTSPGTKAVPTGPGSATAAATAGGAAGPGGTGSTPGTGGAGGPSPGGPGSGPGPTPSATGSPSTPPSSPPPGPPGPVTVTPNLLVLASILGGPATGTLTLTAGGGTPTHYAITIPSSLLGRLSVTPTSGTLAAGRSTQVTVTLVGILSADTQIAVTPGGQSVTVLLAVGLDAATVRVPSPVAALSPAEALNPIGTPSPRAAPSPADKPSPAASKARHSPEPRHNPKGRRNP